MATAAAATGNGVVRRLGMDVEGDGAVADGRVDATKRMLGRTMGFGVFLLSPTAAPTQPSMADTTER